MPKFHFEVTAKVCLIVEDSTFKDARREVCTFVERLGLEPDEWVGYGQCGSNVTDIYVDTATLNIEEVNP